MNQSFIHFSNMTPEEFFRLNSEKIPPEFEKYLEVFLKDFEETKKELEVTKHALEITEEQVYFARNLIGGINTFAENNLSKAKMKVYNQIREDSYFEV